MFQQPDIRFAEGVDIVEHTITMRDPDGKLVKMDLGVADVHVDAALSNYISGYRNGEFGADKVSAVVTVNKASNYFFQYNPDNALAPTNGTETAPGADVAEITPQLSTYQYQTKGYALAAKLPTELLANQDAPLNLEMAATRMCMDKLLLNREVRVAAQAYTSGNFSSAQSLVTTLTSSTKWNGGANADPVRNIRNLCELSLSPVTHMAMALPTWNAFTENPAVQKYVFAKIGAKPLPDASSYEEWAGLLDLPVPLIMRSKVKNTSGAYPFVWASHVALVRRPPGDAISDMDVATFKTFRWNGAGANTLPTEFGGTVQGGFTVRSYFNPFAGKRGSRFVVVAHDDAEVVTGGLSGVSVVGGLILNAFS